MARSAVHPVGFAGELTKIERVAGVIAASTAATSSTQRPLSSPIGTGTARAPRTFAAPEMFGHAGVGTRTSSPAPVVSCSAIWIDCMPDAVT